MSELTRKQKKAYLKGLKQWHVRQCPFCGSEELTREIAEPGEIWMDIRMDFECGKCLEIWSELYKLVNVGGYEDDD